MVLGYPRPESYAESEPRGYIDRFSIHSVCIENTKLRERMIVIVSGIERELDTQT